MSPTTNRTASSHSLLCRSLWTGTRFHEAARAHPACSVPVFRRPGHCDCARVRRPRRERSPPCDLRCRCLTMTDEAMLETLHHISLNHCNTSHPPHPTRQSDDLRCDDFQSSPSVVRGYVTNSAPVNVVLAVIHLIWPASFTSRDRSAQTRVTAGTRCRKRARHRCGAFVCRQPQRHDRWPPMLRRRCCFTQR